MTHDELRGLTGAYALGTLTDSERRELETHLSTCAECTQEVAELARVANGLAYAVPQLDLPAGLRDRVLRAAVQSDPAPQVTPFRPRASAAIPTWLAVAASIAAVALGLYAMTLRQRVGELQERLRDANARAEGLERTVNVARATADRANEFRAILTASDARRIDLAGQPPAPGAAGRAFWSPSRRQVVVTADNLPSLAAGRTYQLWVIPPGKGSKPVSAGLLDLEPGGHVLTLASTNVEQVGTVAVTEEPAGGVPQPTGPMVIAGQN
jgi:anti-sigma-K factor RskA